MNRTHHHTIKSTRRLTPEAYDKSGVSHVTEGVPRDIGQLVREMGR
jgi:hypothetical protein